MYAAEIKQHKERFVFQVSGKLWQRSLVMRDLQTGSLWAHLLGECMEGPLKGNTLTPIPSVITSWKDWKKAHPKTSVLSLKRSANRFNSDSFRNPSSYVIGIKHLNTTRAWPFNILSKKPVYQDKLGTEEVVVIFHKDSSAGFIFNRKIGAKLLNFSPALNNGNLISTDGTAWDPWQAKAISGPQKGQLLERRHAIPSFRKAWLKFHPDSSIAE